MEGPAVLTAPRDAQQLDVDADSLPDPRPGPLPGPLPDPQPEPQPGGRPEAEPDASSPSAALPVRAALSPSRAADFLQCPLLYRFRVVDRLAEAPSAAAVRGTVVHAVLERLFDLPAPERTLAAARAMLGPQWERLLADQPELAALFPEDVPEDTAESTVGDATESSAGDAAGAATGGSARETALADWLASADALVERWFTLEDPTRLEPAERELYVETTLDDGLVLRGYVDRLDVATTGEVRVVDYKTGRAPSELFEAKALFQMRFYALVLWRTTGVVPRLLQLVYLGDGQVLRHAPDEAELLATERKVRALWAAIERAATTGDWRPNRSRLCGWCDHQALCPAWGGTPPPLPTQAVVRALDPRASAVTGPAEE
jgi:putative RecB family exonuclease